MKKEYDFSNAEQGRFFETGRTLEIPVYLDGDVAKRIARAAGKDAADLSAVVNDMLRKDLELLEIIEK